MIFGLKQLDGDSMMPTLKSGDIAVVLPIPAVNKRLAAAKIGKRLVLKRYQKDRLGRVYLSSDNPEGDEYFLAKNQRAWLSIPVNIGLKSLKRSTGV